MQRVWKKFLCGVMATAILLSGTAFMPQTAEAAVYSWMSTARKMSLNQTITGTAKNNHGSTLMDPWNKYYEFFYINIPSRMEVTLTASIKGNSAFLYMRLYNRDGEEVIQQIPRSAWKYSRAADRSSVSKTVTLAAGEYYIKQYDFYKSDTESRAYTLRVSGKTQTTAVGKMKTPKLTQTSYTSASLSLTRVSGAAKYVIYYTSTSPNGTYRKLGTITGATAKIKNLYPNRMYYFKVRAYSSNGKIVGNLSNAVGLSTVIPGKVYSFRVSARSQTSVTLKWSKKTWVSGYQIFRSTSSGSGYKLIGTVSASTTSCRNTGLKRGTTYYYRILPIVKVNGGIYTGNRYTQIKTSTR